MNNVLLHNDIYYPYLKNDITITIRDGVCSLIHNNECGEIAIFRITPVCAVIIAQFNGVNHISNILSLIGILFDLDITKSTAYIQRVLNMFNGFIEESEGRVRNLPNTRFILNNVDKYTEDDITEKRRKYPRDIYYSATNNCNFFCRYCYRDSKPVSKSEYYVPYERWDIILKEASENDCRFLNIAGGDPLCRQDIVELIKIASKYNIKTKVSTKKKLSLETVVELKNSGLSIFQISLDSSDPDICAYLTCVNDSFEQAIQSIEFATKVGLYTIVSATITKINIGQVVQLVELLDKMGVDAVNIGTYVPSCGRNDNRFVPDPAQLDMLDYQVYEMRKKNHRIEIIYHYSLFGHQETNINQLSVERANCRASKDIITIRHDGVVAFCDALLNYNDIYMGNINDNTIGEIWTSHEMTKWVTPNPELYKSTKCGGCLLFYKCFEKRCYKRSIMVYGTPHNIDPLCPFGEAKKDIVWREVMA